MAGLIFIYGFFVSAFLAMSPGFYFRPHYFVLILVPIALLAGYFVVESRQLISDRVSAPQLVSFLPLVLLTILCSTGLYYERNYLFISSPDEVSRSAYGKRPFPESIVVANYIREHSGPNDEIAVLGSEPQIYFYSNRVSVTGHIYMYNLTEIGSIADRFRRELISDIESRRPLYIVKISYNDSWYDYSPLGNPEAGQKLEEWSDAYLNKYYKRVGLIDIYQDGTKYYWDTDAANAKPYSNSFVTVWRRETKEQGAPPTTRDSSSP
jgi:hypothetical protein